MKTSKRYSRAGQTRRGSERREIAPKEKWWCADLNGTKHGCSAKGSRHATCMEKVCPEYLQRKRNEKTLVLMIARGPSRRDSAAPPVVRKMKNDAAEPKIYLTQAKIAI
jgi:hypothetical protein